MSSEDVGTLFEAMLASSPIRSVGASDPTEEDKNKSVPVDEKTSEAPKKSKFPTIKKQSDDGPLLNRKTAILHVASKTEVDDKGQEADVSSCLHQR